MLEGNFIQAIVDCFNPQRANAFDYNLLEPLQKLLRLSSSLAVSLARSDLYSGMLQKLNHRKAVVRLNLLRIIRSISEPSDEVFVGITDFNLFEAVKRLAESDTAVLVRNMAGEIVRANVDKLTGTENCRTRPGQIRPSFTPPNLNHSMSTPMTPTHISRTNQYSSFLEGCITPRRIQVRDGSEPLHRPTSIDSSQMYSSQRVSIDIPTNGNINKSRLPRTSVSSRFSKFHISANMSDETQSQPNQKENGDRLREYSKLSGALLENGGTGLQQGSHPRRRYRAPSECLKRMYLQ